jgi:predicted transcriptional regulator
MKMMDNQKINSAWKKNLNKILNKNSNTRGNQLQFQSINTGKNLGLQECLFDDLLPKTLVSSPISSIENTDNIWIACSMLSRVSDTTNNLVVLQNEFPLGILGGKEILKGLLKNPTPYYFHDILVEEIMNRRFYLDTREAKLNKILEQMCKTESEFTILQNSKQSFSAISIREILEVGALCKSNFEISDLPDKKIKNFRRDDAVEDIIKSLLQDNIEFLLLENESLFIDSMTIIEKIVGDLNYLKNCNNFLDLNASIFKLERPKLIPSNLKLSEICQTMLSMKHPYVMTSNHLFTPRSILEILSAGYEN